MKFESIFKSNTKKTWSQFMVGNRIVCRCRIGLQVVIKITTRQIYVWSYYFAKQIYLSCTNIFEEYFKLKYFDKILPNLPDFVNLTKNK